jgi:peptidyl-prolyl cis-trans isomerase B (cyclophilin B)
VAGFWSKFRNAAGKAPTPLPAAASLDAEVAVFATCLGRMVLAFWPEVAPVTVENFKKLVRDGFFDGSCFHRVVKDFMIQGGDPLTKHREHERLWGTGDPGYSIKAEFSDRPHTRGVISMARSSDPDSAGSQFFICLADAPFLDGQYTAFGHLIAGDDVLGSIGEVAVGPSPDGELSRPLERVELESVRLVPQSSLA